MPSTTYPFDNMSCTGAEIPDVRRNQLAPLSQDTNLITISIGGNDFIGIMRNCLLPVSCADSMRAKYSSLPGIQANLTDLYRDIRARAPNSLVVVLGYPHVLESPYLAGMVITCSTLLYGFMYIMPFLVQNSLLQNLTPSQQVRPERSVGRRWLSPHAYIYIYIYYIYYILYIIYIILYMLISPPAWQVRPSPVFTCSMGSCTSCPC
jgi:hypothetical protein